MSHNVNKEICNTCQFWTGKKTDSKLKCYAGYCPAKLRDNTEQKSLIKNKKQKPK